MAGIILTYDVAMAASKDAGNRSMRNGGRSKWSRKDYNASVARLEELARVFYRANVENVEEVPMDAAFFALQQTRGMSCIAR